MANYPKLSLLPLLIWSTVPHLHMSKVAPHKIPINRHMDNLQFCPFKQYFSHIRTMEGDNEKLCAMEPHL